MMCLVGISYSSFTVIWKEKKHTYLSKYFPVQSKSPRGVLKKNFSEKLLKIHRKKSNCTGISVPEKVDKSKAVFKDTPGLVFFFPVEFPGQLFRITCSGDCF